MIIYAPDAERDVERVHAWYVERSAAAALRDRETRRHGFRFGRTTYLVDYRFEAEAIVILRMWHGRQERPE